MREKIGNISAISAALGKDMRASGADEKTVRNAVLASEELLLLYKNRLQNDDTDVSAAVKREARKFSLKICVSAEELSPQNLQSQADIRIFDTLVKNCGFSVSYSYSDGVNQIEIVIRKYYGSLRNLLFSFRFIQNKPTIFAAFFLHLLSIAANIYIPVLTGKLIVAYTENVMMQILYTAAALLLMKLLYHTTFNIAGVLYSKASYYSENALRRELAGELFRLKGDNFETNGTGTFIQRMTTDLQTISTGISNILDVFSEGVYYIGVLLASAALNFWVFAAEIVTFTVLLLIENHRALRLEIDNRKTRVSADRLSGRVIDYVNGICEIKLLNAGEPFTKKISAISSEYADNLHNATKNSRLWIIISSCTVSALSFAIMILLGYDLQNGSISIPTALILFNYFTVIGRPSVALLQRAVDFFKQYDLAAERVRNLYEGSEFPREAYGSVCAQKLRGNVVFDHVTFAYNHDELCVPDIEIIKDGSFEIKHGERVAFVGKSGSGKSTIFKLLSRQVGCYCGNITIDGYELSELSQDCLYDNMSVISQSTVLFNCSIKENLLAAKPDATMEQLRDVCRKACILEDIERTENGFDTELGEKGVRFSGGQRQRLAIARALLRNSRILLLDEATSAMDNITQDQIMKAIENIGRDITVIMIAHRLSTVKNADKIMLVGDKKILASGTHEELMRDCAEYRSLYEYEGR